MSLNIFTFDILSVIMVVYCMEERISSSFVFTAAIFVIFAVFLTVKLKGPPLTQKRPIKVWAPYTLAYC